MSAFFIEMLLVIPVTLVWFVVVAVIVHPFGVQMPLRLSDFRQRTSWLQLLTFPQYLGIYGVLCFGCGMFILTTLSHYLEWRYFNGSSGSLSESELLANGLQWLLGGVAFGLGSFFSRGTRPNAK